MNMSFRALSRPACVAVCIGAAFILPRNAHCLTPDAQQTAASIAKVTPPPHARTVAPVSTIERLTDVSALDTLGRGRAAILISRGHNARDAAVALNRFQGAVARVHRANHDELADMHYFVVDDASAVVPSVTLMTRLGIEHKKPFVIVLDRFASTERKFLMTDTEIPTEDAIVRFINDFGAGLLRPALIGQPRPRGDRHPRFPALVEVVTDSFDELVLNSHVDVLLEAYTTKCDACKAAAPRLRMFAALAARHLPTLRVAEMNILDNDRDTQHLPEVRSGDGVACTMVQTTDSGSSVSSLSPRFSCCSARLIS